MAIMVRKTIKDVKLHGHEIEVEFVEGMMKTSSLKFPNEGTNFMSLSARKGKNVNLIIE